MTRPLIRPMTRQRGFSLLELLVAFANRSATVLVASDVAARGLDIADLAAVINFDLANDADTHLHRVGRTGRAGKAGLALSLCTSPEAARVGIFTRAQGVALVWRKWTPAGTGKPPPAPNRTLIVDAGRQDKLRPADLLGRGCRSCDHSRIWREQSVNGRGLE